MAWESAEPAATRGALGEDLTLLAASGRPRADHGVPVEALSPILVANRPLKATSLAAGTRRQGWMA